MSAVIPGRGRKSASPEFIIAARAYPTHFVIIDSGLAAFAAPRNDERQCARRFSIRCSPRSQPCPASGRSSKSCSAAFDARRGAGPGRRSLFHLPAGFVDRRNQPKLSEVVPDTVVTVAVTAERTGRRRRTGPARLTTSIPAMAFTRSSSPISMRGGIIWKSSFRKARGATCRALSPFTTVTCRWCIPTASWMRWDLPACR